MTQGSHIERGIHTHPAEFRVSLFFGSVSLPARSSLAGPIAETPPRLEASTGQCVGDQVREQRITRKRPRFHPNKGPDKATEPQVLKEHLQCSACHRQLNTGKARQRRAQMAVKGGRNPPHTAFACAQLALLFGRHYSCSPYGGSVTTGMNTVLLVAANQLMTVGEKKSARANALAPYF